MNKSATIGKLALALSKAQAELKGRYGSQEEGELVRSLVRIINPRVWRGFKYKSPRDYFHNNIACGISDCIYWTGTKHRLGYGVIGKKSTYAHRMSWTRTHGVIPDGMNVLHRCDVRLCVNPDHLFLGTQKDNIRDMQLKGRKRAARGEGIGSSKLTERQVLEIRSLYGSDMVDCSGLAIGYGVSAANIWNIVNRKTWRHV